ncbi:hypothetical protein VNI00_007926 [Paramarasmius palmivorus]|uniref:Uncharacterized protein n=1 Tax=Paramarasmius palmivorus TaxID=297713 RepID=A0AAW0CXU6_9AGAR
MSATPPTYSDPQPTAGDIKVPLETSPQPAGVDGSPRPPSPPVVVERGDGRDRILLLSLIASILFCVTVFILSAIAGPASSACLGIIAPIILFFHHSYYLDKYYKGAPDSESRVPRIILLVILLVGGLLTFVGGIVALAQRWASDISIAGGSLEIVHTVIVALIAWRCCRALKKTSGAIRLPDDSSNATIPPIRRAGSQPWKPVINNSLPLPLWALKISVELCIIIPILSIGAGDSPSFVLNIVVPILVIVHHLFLVLVHTDKVYEPSESGETKNPEPLFPFFRRDDKTFVFLSLVLLFIQALVGAIIVLVWHGSRRGYHYYYYSRPATALVQGILLTIETVLLAVLAVCVLIKILKKKDSSATCHCGNNVAV